MAKNLKSKVTNKEQLMFVRRALRKRITEFRQQNRRYRNDTETCHALGNEVGLSGATLMKVFNGDFTFRTVQKMAAARWFLMSEFIAAKNSQPQQAKPTQQNTANTQAQAKSEWSRGYDQGRADGFRSGQQAVKQNAQAAVQGAIQAAYDQGYREGRRAGFNEGFNDGRAARSRSGNTSTVSTSSTVPMERLRQLFNLNEASGTTAGETFAARKAAGKVLARWVKEQFKQDVEIDIK